MRHSKALYAVDLGLLPCSSSFPAAASCLVPLSASVHAIRIGRVRIIVLLTSYSLCTSIVMDVLLIVLQCAFMTFGVDLPSCGYQT